MEPSFRHVDLTRDDAIDVLVDLGATRREAQRILKETDRSTFSDTTAVVGGIRLWVDQAMERDKPYSVRTMDQR